MSIELSDADQVSDLLLPLGGPYQPDRVVEAARTVAELVRRLNHATLHHSSLRYPPQLNRTTGALRSALYGLDQTFTQLAHRLDGFAADPRLEHDERGDPWAECAEAAQHLRHAAGELRAVTEPLDAANAITHHLGYDTSSARPRQHTFPPPTTASTVHEGPSRPAPLTAADPAVSTAPAAGRTGRHR